MKQWMTIFVLATTFTLSAAPKKYYARQDQNPINQALDEMQHLIQDVQYEATNHEAEMRTFEEKLNNQEIAVDALWKQFNDANHVSKEKMRDVMDLFESKVSNLELAVKTSNNDVELLKKHLSESGMAISQYKSKINSLEKIAEVQNQNIEHLEAALRALLDALQIKDVALQTQDPFSSQAQGLIYQVKAGDSLEKIARKYNTSVAKLREMNHLNDQHLIIVGQKLKLPES